MTEGCVTKAMQLSNPVHPCGPAELIPQGCGLEYCASAQRLGASKEERARLTDNALQTMLSDGVSTNLNTPDTSPARSDNICMPDTSEVMKQKMYAHSVT